MTPMIPSEARMVNTDRTFTTWIIDKINKCRRELCLEPLSVFPRDLNSFQDVLKSKAKIEYPKSYPAYLWFTKGNGPHMFGVSHATLNDIKADKYRLDHHIEFLSQFLENKEIPVETVCDSSGFLRCAFHSD